MKYPRTWQPVPETADPTCHQLAGTYRDLGQVGSGEQHVSYSLTKFLFGDPSAGMPQATQPVQGREEWRGERVTLSFPEAGQMQVLASGPEGESSSRVFTAEAEQFACHAGRVIIKRARWVDKTGYGRARFAETLELQSSDGYLVMKWQENSLALLGYLLPVTYRQSNWYRFERYRDQR